MAQLTIKNIGPIKNVNIKLNKVNVIIGPQSSGKSTITKIACFCSWVEKKVSLDQSFEYFLKDDNFMMNLVTFHKLEGYFSHHSVIVYASSVVEFSFNYKDKVPHFKWIAQYNYVRTKISYIPAERNIVSMIADWKQVNLPKNNIFNFMSDWNIARKAYSSENSLSIDSLETTYYYDENKDIDFLETSNGNKIQLINASSGQQSMIPLYVLVNYFTKSIYENKVDESIENRERDAKIFSMLTVKSLSDVANGKVDINDPKKLQQFFDSFFLMEEKEDKVQLPPEVEKFAKQLTNYLTHYTTTNYTSLFIEEPELNLFPSTQKDLLYFTLNAIKEKEHQLFLTTHSPYILYALNNCIMGWLVKDNMPENIAKSLESYHSWIDPKDVSAWQIKDGTLISIQEQQTNSIGKHYFNEVMNETMDEYYMMLNYFDPKYDEK